MRFFGLGSANILAALVLGLVGGSAFAADAPKATDLIFEKKHLEKLGKDATVDYKFNRIASDPKILGMGFSDDITFKIVADKPEGRKDIDLQIYTGERARDLQKMENMAINPVFAVYFAQGVSTFNKLAGGQVNYLQKSFTDGWAKATVEPVKVTYKGKPIDAYHISMTPYKGDKYESKMQGWEDARYDLILSDEVPGEIVDLNATYHNRYPPATLRLSERITLDGVTGLEEAK